MTKFIKKTIFSKSFDRRDPDPKKDYGIGGVDLWFVLKGKKGAISASFRTGWYLPSCFENNYYLDQHERERLRCFMVDMHTPSCGEIDDDSDTNACTWLDNGKCYLSSTLRDDEKVLQKALLERGSIGLWNEMIKIYYREFNKRASND